MTEDKWLDAYGKEIPEKFFGPLPKLVFGRWMLLKLWLFGEKCVSKSGPWTLVVYHYKGINYITRYDTY